MRRAAWLFAQDILDAINAIESHVGDMTFDEFKNEKKTLDSVVWEIHVIGEATKNIPKSLRQKYSSVPWKEMAGMRDRVVHFYFGIDYDIVGSKVWGFSVTHKSFGGAAFANTACSLARRRFTLTHELGHLIMDHNHTATVFSERTRPDRTVDHDRSALVETRANTFAASFLMPEQGMRDALSQFADFDKGRTQIAAHMLPYLAEYFGVSYDSLLWLLLNLRLVSKEEREQLASLLPLLPSQESFGLQEGRAATHLPEKYQTLAFEAYRQMKISISKLAEFIRVDLYQARKLVKELGLRQVTVETP